MIPESLYGTFVQDAIWFLQNEETKIQHLQPQKVDIHFNVHFTGKWPSFATEKLNKAHMGIYFFTHRGLFLMQQVLLKIHLVN